MDERLDEAKKIYADAISRLRDLRVAVNVSEICDGRPQVVQITAVNAAPSFVADK